MFGRILEITEDTAVVENVSGRVETSILGMHLVFEEKYKILAEISAVDEKQVSCVLVGEFVNGRFKGGLDHRIAPNSNIRSVNKEEVIELLGEQNVDTPDSLYIGKNITYEGFNVAASMNDLFSNHFAIIGNSGSGKSCTVARLFQNIFYRKQHVPYNSHFALFDVYGEYHTALNAINQTDFCRCKYLTTDVTKDLEHIVKFPPYLLEVDDIALLLGATSPLQLPIIEKSLKYVYLFTEEEEKVAPFKNNIIAKAILDILASGRSSNQIRDQIIAVLSSFNTSELNLKSEIVEPGYTRTLTQCLAIDATGKMNTIHLVSEFLGRFVNNDLVLTDDMKPTYYTLKDLYKAFEFALISEGALKSDSVFDLSNMLKVRLDSIINGSYGKYFEVDEEMTREEYINNLYTSDTGEKVQIVNFNLNYVDERFAKVLTKLYSKLFLDYAVTLKNNQGFSVEIMLEEAHRYVTRDSDTDILGYNIFDRITKEGRKYGVILGLITQRPSELSTTALSQCSNYIVLRMYHPVDIGIVKDISNGISEHDLDKLKTLASGTALCFGTAFKIPLFAKIDLANPTPSSSNVSVSTQWFETPDTIKTKRITYQTGVKEQVNTMLNEQQQAIQNQSVPTEVNPNQIQEGAPIAA